LGPRCGKNNGVGGHRSPKHSSWQAAGQHWPELKTRSPGTLYQQPARAGLHLATGQNESSDEHGVPSAGEGAGVSGEHACGQDSEHASWQGVGQHWPEVKARSPGTLYEQPGGAGLHAATGQNESSGEHGAPSAGIGAGVSGERTSWQGVGQHWPELLKTRSPGTLYSKPGGAGLHLATGQNESSGEHGVPGAGAGVVVVALGGAAPPSHQVPTPWHSDCSPVSKGLPSLEGQLVPGRYLRFPHSAPHCPQRAGSWF
jgi:hypothetical protein